MGGNLQLLDAWLDTYGIFLLLAGAALIGVAHFLQWSRDMRAALAYKAELLAAPKFTHWPKVSLLVPAWNEGGRLEHCIQSILGLRYPNKELIICAGGHDDTLAIAARHASRDVTVIEQLPGQGKQGALRACFERCNGEIVYLTDADCEVGDACFEATIAPIILEGEDAATGYWQPSESCRKHPLVLYQWTHHLYWHATIPAYTHTLDGVNAAVRCSTLRALQAFETPAPIGTDYVLSQQLHVAGCNIRTVRKSLVYTHYPATVAAYWRQTSRWFRNRLVLGVRFGSRVDIWEALRAAGVACILLLVPLLAAFGFRWLWYLWLALVLHLGLAQLRMARFALRAGQGQDIAVWHYVLFTCCMPLNWIASVRGLLESLSPRRRFQW